MCDNGRIVHVNKLRCRKLSSNEKLTRFIAPLMTFVLFFAMSSAAIVLSQTLGGAQTSPLQRRRLVERGHFTGERELQQIVTWQTPDTRGGRLPLATAHLAIETVGARPRILWQAEGGESQYLVDSVRAADLDGDGVPEITTLWWNRDSTGAALRVFHWDRGSHTFVELRFENEPAGVRSYRLILSAVSTRRLAVYVHPESGRTQRTVPAGEYELRGSMLIRVRGGETVTAQGESGIEGQAVVSPARPGPTREGEPDTAPYKTSLTLSSASDGREIRQLETGSDGRFRVVLPPGIYKIGPAARAGRFFPRAGEQTVTVVQGRFAHVTIEFDSGMR
jgi:hypothetical protein